MIEEFWIGNGGGTEKILHLHFVPPFSVQARIQTALTRKFLQVRDHPKIKKSYFVTSPSPPL
jgi:hypothetical protein